MLHCCAAPPREVGEARFAAVPRPEMDPPDTLQHAVVSHLTFIHSPLLLARAPCPRIVQSLCTIVHRLCHVGKAAW